MSERRDAEGNKTGEISNIRVGRFPRLFGEHVATEFLLSGGLELDVSKFLVLGRQLLTGG